MPDQAIEPRVIEAKPKPEVNEPLLKWRAPEFLFFEKSSLWFVGAGAVAVVLVGLAVYFHQWLMALVVAATAAVVYQHAGRVPRELECVITTMGIQVGEHFYPYNQLKTYWLIYQPPAISTLNLQLTRRLAPQISVQLSDTDPAQVRAALESRLPEESQRGEEWVDRIARLIRF